MLGTPNDHWVPSSIAKNFLVMYLCDAFGLGEAATRGEDEVGFGLGGAEDKAGVEDNGVEDNGARVVGARAEAKDSGARAEAKDNGARAGVVEAEDDPLLSLRVLIFGG